MPPMMRWLAVLEEEEDGAIRRAEAHTIILMGSFIIVIEKKLSSVV